MNLADLTESAQFPAFDFIFQWYRIGLSMELFLNSAWALLVIAIVCHWLRFGRRAPADRRQSFLALIVLVAVLFPVISITDDLWSLHNPAETETCQRRDHLVSSSHVIFPAVAALPVPALAELSVGFQPLIVPLPQPLLAVDNPVFDAIESRPPPAACLPSASNPIFV
jgi:hypothetical protein